MSADESIRFEFNFEGIKIEISGESDFVDTLYRDLMRDIQAARQDLDAADQENLPDQQIEQIVVTPEQAPVWVHRCSDMMRKIYMSTLAELEGSPLRNALDFGAVRTFYCDDAVFNAFFPGLSDNRTIWAELTDEGQRTIRKLPYGSPNS